MKIAEKVDRAHFLSMEIKKMEEELDGLKKDLKAHAKKHNYPEIVGKSSKAVFGPTGWTSIEPKKLHETLKDMELSKKFYDLVKVKITDAKKLIGETVFDSISKSGSIAYNKVTFKKSQ